MRPSRRLVRSRSSNDGSKVYHKAFWFRISHGGLIVLQCSRFVHNERKGCIVNAGQQSRECSWGKQCWSRAFRKRVFSTFDTLSPRPAKANALSSGGWVKIKLKLPHFHVSDTCRVSICVSYLVLVSNEIKGCLA